jgi:hypothetical protein
MHPTLNVQFHSSIRLEAAIRRMRRATVGCCALLVCAVSPGKSAVLDHETFRSYVERFNADDRELFSNTIPNAAAWDFLKENIPLFECPDKEL